MTKDFSNMRVDDIDLLYRQSDKGSEIELVLQFNRQSERLGIENFTDKAP